jgi:hypothetical protein
MDISNDSLPWNSEDVTLFRQFLKTQTGKRFLPKIVESVPPLLAKGADNEILIRSGEVRGYQLAAQSILSLSVLEGAPIPATPTAYPPLDDDTQHPDTPKLAATEAEVLAELQKSLTPIPGSTVFKTPPTTQTQTPE